jgi:hypothetical protein
VILITIKFSISLAVVVYCDRYERIGKYDKLPFMSCCICAAMVSYYYLTTDSKEFVSQRSITLHLGPRSKGRDSRCTWSQAGILFLINLVYLRELKNKKIVYFHGVSGISYL